MKRSRCASGRAYVPSISSGFWVATTRNGCGQQVGVPVDGDLPLLHRLEQRRLRLGGGAVDLVGDHDVREDRALLELELAVHRVEDAHAGHVAGEQVGGELDAADGGVDGCRESARQHGLADAGHVLDEQVPLGEQAHEGAADGIRLSVDHAPDRGEDAVGHAGEPLRRHLAVVPMRHPSWRYRPLRPPQTARSGGSAGERGSLALSLIVTTRAALWVWEIADRRTCATAGDDRRCIVRGANACGDGHGHHVP